MKMALKILLSFTVFVLSSCVYAQSASHPLVNPQVLLQKTIQSLQKDIKHHRATLEHSKQQLYKTVQAHIMPIVDLQKMAQITLGNKWRHTSETQRHLFIDAFSKLLTRTYANALLSLSEYRFSLRPLRGNHWKVAKDIQIQGDISRGGKSSSVTYYLTRQKDNQWQIYDFAVEGVSFMQNFHAQFESFADVKTLNKKLVAINQAAV